MDNNTLLRIIVALTIFMYIGIGIAVIRHEIFLRRIAGNQRPILVEHGGIGFYIRILAYISIIACLFVSTHYICEQHPRIESQNGLDVDYVGIVVGVLSGIFTLLVGWQIFSNLQERERFRNFTNQFENRIQNLEECCSQGRQRLSKLDGLEDKLKDTIYFEVYYAITGNELIKDIKTENWIKDTFISYTNPFSQSLRTIARQFLLAEFSKRILEEKSESLINDIVKKVPKIMVEALQKELSENRDWIQYTESDKINELINKILESYPKDSNK